VTLYGSKILVQKANIYFQVPKDEPGLKPAFIIPLWDGAQFFIQNQANSGKKMMKHETQ
jgi:hypothetical protein